MEVKLHRAQLLWSHGYYWCEGFSLDIDIENLGYEKKVFIHFDHGGERAATFTKMLSGNRELWSWSSNRYDTEGYTVSGRGFGRVKFCLRYIVNGVTYWDNNGGWDYCLQSEEPEAPATWKWPHSFH